MSTRLQNLYQAAAELAEKHAVDFRNQDMLVGWIRKYCSYRPGTEFFLYMGICAAMADREAQSQGYRDQGDRAAKLAFANRRPA